MVCRWEALLEVAYSYLRRKNSSNNNHQIPHCSSCSLIRSYSDWQEVQEWEGDEQYNLLQQCYHLHWSSQQHRRHSRHYQSHKRLGLYHILFLYPYILDNWGQGLNIRFYSLGA